MIDIHTHIGRVGLRPTAFLDEAGLLQQLDQHGIEKAVVLPVVSPECLALRATAEDALEAYRRHPDRIIPFCNLDPRSGNSPEADFAPILSEYKAAGCRGLGEVTANLPFDDPFCLNLYQHCGRAGLPVLFHLAAAVGQGLYGVADEMGLPRLEKALRACSQTVFIGHAMSFWAEVASNVDEGTRGGYPVGPVAGPGRTVELLQQYPNLCGDLSAGSGFNAINRDPEFGYWLLEALQDKLLLGTDIARPDQPEIRIPAYLRGAREQGRISEECYRKITRSNAERLLGLAAP